MRLYRIQAPLENFCSHLNMSSELIAEFEPAEKKLKSSEGLQSVEINSSILAIATEALKRPEITSDDTPKLLLSDNPTNDKDENDSGENLSKRQRKKLAKLEKWEKTKKEKRIKEREKYRQKRQEAIARGEPIRTGASRKALKHNKIDKSSNPFTLAVDLDYDDLMIDKDICKCAKQLLWVYTINRKSKTPLHLYYTGLQEGGRIHDALLRNDGYQNWDIKIKNESYFDVFDRDSIVYLTSDSDNVLTDLDPKSVYIIGGLVDHNHHKGLTLDRATEQGFRTARLPLSEHVAIKTRTVLTIVHG